jgi:hypothetical protein
LISFSLSLPHFPCDFYCFFYTHILLFEQLLYVSFESAWKVPIPIPSTEPTLRTMLEERTGQPFLIASGFLPISFRRLPSSYHYRHLSSLPLSPPLSPQRIESNRPSPALPLPSPPLSSAAYLDLVLCTSTNRIDPTRHACPAFAATARAATLASPTAATPI